MKQYYALIRSLHLYFGLFISPFILLFAISVLVMNHPLFLDRLFPVREIEPEYRQLYAFEFAGSDSLMAKKLLRLVNLDGEIDWITRTDTLFSFPLNKPGLTRWISLNRLTGKVTITGKEFGFFGATRYLHTMPGQHNARMRGNSLLIKLWRVATDTLVYVVLFVSASGVFLWYYLRPERTLGIVSMGVGLVFLVVIVIFLF
jgi:hypothetical protein